MAAWAAVGAVGGGWLCFAVRALSALCRRARDPAWRVEQSVRRTAGRRRDRRDVALFALMRCTRLGAWRDEQFDLKVWMAVGSLAGSTFAVIMVPLH